jgi:hypothetical protein
MITGLTPKQQQIADQLWRLDTEQAVRQWQNTLSSADQRDVLLVRDLIIAEYLDQIQTVDPRVTDYLAGL